jgi:hypothetical protein
MTCVTSVGCLPACSLTKISSLHVVPCIVHIMVALLDVRHSGHDLAPVPSLNMEVHSFAVESSGINW